MALRTSQYGWRWDDNAYILATVRISVVVDVTFSSRSFTSQGVSNTGEAAHTNTATRSEGLTERSSQLERWPVLGWSSKLSDRAFRTHWQTPVTSAEASASICRSPTTIRKDGRKDGRKDLKKILARVIIALITRCIRMAVHGCQSKR